MTKTIDRVINALLFGAWILSIIAMVAIGYLVFSGEVTGPYFLPQIAFGTSVAMFLVMTWSTSTILSAGSIHAYADYLYGSYRVSGDNNIQVIGSGNIIPEKDESSV